MSKYSRPARDKYSYWMNVKPIKNVHEALELLWPGEHDSTEGRYISTKSERPELWVGWFSDGDSGGAHSGTHYYQINASVVETLTREHWIAPREIPHMGYTETQKDKLALTRHGKEELKHFLEAEQKKAHGLLIPGKHSKFSGVFDLAGHGRTHGHYGELFFLFRTPIQEKVRVYPRLKKIRKLKPEKV